MTLVDEAELERLRQKQLKDYNPALKSLVSIQTAMESLLADPDLTDEEKHRILNVLKDKFSTLYSKIKNTGQLAQSPSVAILPASPQPTVGASVAAPPNVPPPPAAIPPPLVQAVQPSTTADAVPQIAAPPMNKPDEAFEDAADTVAGVGAEPAGTQSTAETRKWPSLTELRLPPTFGNKFQSLIDFLNVHSDVISKNAKNELVLDGAPIPNTSFNDLIRSMYVRNKQMNLTGFTNLVSKLHQLKPSLTMFSNQESLAALMNIGRPTQSTPIQSTSRSLPPPETKEAHGKGLAKKLAGSKKRDFLKTKIPPGKRAKLLRVFPI